jgi:hypothetical protein
LKADSIAEKYEVSRAWVYRLLQRRRDTGSLAPRTNEISARTLTGDEEDRLVALITAVARVAERLPVLPPATRGRHVRPPLFVGVYRFY